MTAGLKRDDEAGPVMPVPAEWIGPYRLVQQLGEGGMGVVHLALDESGRAVAIKVLREHIAHDREARERLSREVQTLARVQDARVAAVLDADTECPRPYIVTRYVPGPALDRVVSEHGALTGDALLRVARGLSQALHAIHRAGVIHRDLKPANVLLLDGNPVVIDFGIAHVADDIRLTMTGLVMGTPGYISPEVVEGAPVTEATDWWGWAATLAFAATGAPPFGRGPMQVVLDRVRHGQADLSGVDPRLAPLLAAALSPRAELRPHADEIVEAIDRYAAGAPATLALAVVEPMTQALPVFDPAPPPPEPAWEQDPTADEDELPMARDDNSGQLDPRIGRPSRVGTLLALMVGVLGVAVIWPMVAIGLIIVWSWCARFADRSVTSLVLRRHQRGRRRSDLPVAVVASPWHVVISAVGTVIALLLPALVAIVSVFSASFVVVAVAGGTPAPGRSLTLLVGGFAGIFCAWWGPGGASLRRGSRSLVRGVVPGRTVARIAVATFLLLGGGLGAWGWLRHGQPSWWPWTSVQLPGISGLWQ